MTKRFFAFGCSFTDYHWPTWPDIIAHKLNRDGYECYNFGMAGSGNNLIAKTIRRADAVHQFTDDDIIMILWSSWNREDRYLGENPYWVLLGNVLNNDFYGDDFIMKYWSLDNDIITNIDAIRSVQHYNIAFQGALPHFETTMHNPDSVDYHDPLFDMFVNLPKDNQWNNMEYAAKFSNNLLNHISVHDGHPMPYHSLEFIKTVAQPNMDIKIYDDESAEFVKTITEFMEQLAKKSLVTFGKERIQEGFVPTIVEYTAALRGQLYKGRQADLWHNDQAAIEYLKENLDIMCFNKRK